jgi:hypothetical protein
VLPLASGSLEMKQRREEAGAAAKIRFECGLVPH